MSDIITTEFAATQFASHSPDLQVHLYKEIGISALAAALHVMAKPVASKDVAASDARTIPAILQSDDLAA
ncbi:MAG: hypothetical protein WA733_14950 [Methylocystis sp.]